MRVLRLTSRSPPVTWHDAVLWCNRRSSAEGLRPAYRVSEGWVHWV